MHGDDYELNSQLNYALVVSAVSFERAEPMLKQMGMRAPSRTDHNYFKHELEPIFADLGNRSVNVAHPRRRLPAAAGGGSPEGEGEGVGVGGWVGWGVWGGG